MRKVIIVWSALLVFDVAMLIFDLSTNNWLAAAIMVGLALFAVGMLVITVAGFSSIEPAYRQWRYRADIAAAKAAWATSPATTIPTSTRVPTLAQITASHRVGLYGWHVHHEELTEPIWENPLHRIDYLVAEKPRDELKTRLGLFRPADLSDPKKSISLAHVEQCPNCPWNGKTIFPHKAKESW